VTCTITMKMAPWVNSRTWCRIAATLWGVARSLTSQIHSRELAASAISTSIDLDGNYLTLDILVWTAP
jgi:hypothetical protein